MPNANFSKEDVIAIVSAMLPKFKEACECQDGDAILMHQDAFAADLQGDDITLLGMAVKFAGFYGRTITIIGKHNETIKS